MNSKKSHLSHIAKYLSNEMAMAARIWFYLKNQITPKTKHELNTLKVFFNSMKLNEKNKDIEFDTNKAWLKIRARIQSEGYTGQLRSAFIPKSSYFAIAATVLVMVALSLSVWFYYNPKTITLANMTQSSTIIRTLSDGTQIFLGENTILVYPVRFVGKTRTVKLNGEAYFDVAKNGTKPFIIKTSHADVKVVGTSFNLKTSNSEVHLKVTEGKVKITLNTNQKSALVQTGEAALASKNDIVTYTQPTGQTIKSAMKLLMFQDETLDNIIRVINSAYGSNIKVLGNDLKDMRISVTFDNDISSIVNTLSMSFNLKVTPSPDGTIIISR
jgi:ferric-dicitrate binding protein FerR (iron transport regulator)